MSSLRTNLLEFLIYNECGQLIFHMDFQEVTGILDSKKNISIIGPELSKASNSFVKRMEADRKFKNRM